MAKHTALTVTVVLTLGLCLGGNTAILAVLHHLVLRPPPFPAPDRLVDGALSLLGVEERRGAGHASRPTVRPSNTGDKLRSSEVHQASSAASPCWTAPSATSALLQAGSRGPPRYRP
jgi:hypothetical protein